jgi:superfamily II DNA helicase RecQ
MVATLLRLQQQDLDDGCQLQVMEVATGTIIPDYGQRNNFVNIVLDEAHVVKEWGGT